MSFEMVTDAARIITALQIVVIFTLSRSLANYAGTWTKKGLFFFVFHAALLLIVLLNTIEKLVSDAPPAIIPCLMPFVFAFGIWGAWMKGQLIRTGQE